MNSAERKSDNRKKISGNTACSSKEMFLPYNLLYVEYVFREEQFSKARHENASLSLAGVNNHVTIATTTA